MQRPHIQGLPLSAALETTKPEPYHALGTGVWSFEFSTYCESRREVGHCVCLNMCVAQVLVNALIVQVKSAPIPLSGKAGGLNRSTQHSARTHNALKTKAKTAG